MSTGFDPLGFGEPEPNLDQIMQNLERAAGSLGELRGDTLQRIGQCIENCMSTASQLTGKIAAPVGEAIGSAGQITMDLQGKIETANQFKVAQANELTQQLDSTLRQSGIEIGIPPGAGEPVESIAVGGPIEIGIPGDEGFVIGDGTPVNGDDGEVGDDGIAIGGPPDGENGGGNGNGGAGNGGDTGNGGGGGGGGETTNGGGDTQNGNGGQTFCPPQTTVTTTACPVPVVQCPPTPDVVVNVPPCPVPEQGGETQEQPEAVPSPIFVGLQELELHPFCDPLAYLPANIDTFQGFAFEVDSPVSHFVNGQVPVDDKIARAKQQVESKRFNVLAGMVWWVEYQLQKGIKRVDGIWNSATGFIRQRSAALGNVILARFLIAWGRIVFGPVMDKPDEQLRYMQDSLYPTQFPDQNEATEAYVRGTIDKTTYEQWLRQNNYCTEPWDALTEARTNRVEPLMALQMWKRGFINETQFREQIRKAGYTEETFQTAFKDLGEFIPPITDLVRFMVRDVGDDRLNKTFGLDVDFGEKWKDRIKEWGEQQGITDEAALAYWKAHWRIPSPTQLFDMFHRTRHLPDGHPLKTTQTMVEDALKQDDLLPFWVPRMIDRTYAIPTRRDARRQFETGAITAKQLKENLIKSGYTEDDADDLVAWANINKQQVLLNQPIVRLFRDGLVSEDRVRAALRATKLPDAEINTIVEFASKMGSRRFVNRCVSALRKRYLTGELTLDEVSKELLNVGLNLSQTNAMTGSLLCEQRAQGKQPPTTMLCTWLEEGTLGSAEFVDRLQKVGWSRGDALRILVSCQTKINEKVARQAKQRANEEQRAVEKEQREQQAAQRRLERAQKEAARQREKAERAKQNRDKIMQRNIARFAKDAQLDVDTSAACILSLERDLASNTVLLIDERIRTITTAIERTKPADCSDLKSKANQLADALLEFGEITEELINQVLEVS